MIKLYFFKIIKIILFIIMKEISEQNEKLIENNNPKEKEEISNDIIEKQKLIKESILDKHLDKDLFFSYCMKTKPENGDNLKNWTIEELTTIIKNFTEEQNKYYINTQKVMDQNIDINISQNSDNKNIPQNIYEIPCAKLEKTILNDKEIKSEMKNPRSIEAGFFSNSYILYDIETTVDINTKWIVQRRYSDFIWLRETLTKFFPRDMVAPLPGKKIGGRRFETDFVSKRMENLNKFLNIILKSETFKTSEALIAFLSIIDRVRFEEKKKEINSYIFPSGPEGIKTIEGKIAISEDDYSNEKYFVNINNYFNLQTQIYDKLNEDLSGFYKSIISCVENLAGVQKDFELLHLLNARVSMKKEILKTFEMFGIFFKNWKRVLFNQGDIIKKNVKHFFKYVNMEGNAYSELTKSRLVIKEKFENENKKLLNKKEKLWEQNDISKWEINEDFSRIDRVLLVRDKQYAFSKMCTSESFSVNNLRIMLRYANKKNLDELKKLITNYQERFLNNVKSFANSFYPTLNDALNVWTEVAATVKI